MDKKIRLLQVIPRLDVGGAETGCKDIAQFIAEQNYFSAILCSGGEQIKNIDQTKIKIFKFSVHSKNPFMIFFNIFVILFIVLFYKINIIHVRSRAPAWSCYFASKLLGVSLISTFLLIYAANFSLNLFTLMALVIAIGLVVDDAIVMLENIYRRVEGGESPLIASYKGASQVSFAIIATTVVLIAVFVPLVFVKGIVGKLFTELALTYHSQLLFLHLLRLHCLRCLLLNI